MKSYPSFFQFFYCCQSIHHHHPIHCSKMEQLSIQNFYRREVATSSSTDEIQNGSSSPLPGDSFNQDEVDAVTHPAGLPPWEPAQPYHIMEIGSLVPGLGSVTVTGRVLNFTKRSYSSKPGKPSFYYYLYVKDDTGIIAV